MADLTPTQQYWHGWHQAALYACLVAAALLTPMYVLLYLIWKAVR